MLGIVTCLRAKTLAHNWDLHVWLLQRTLKSMLAQTDESFRVVVACHEIPDIPEASHSKVHFLPLDIPIPQRNLDDMCVDKVLKLTAGIDFAIAQGCDYVMFADGDDLVSRHISELVATNVGHSGWYATVEYFYRYGGKWVRKYTLPGWQSGPTIIVRSDLLRFEPDSRYRGERVNTLAAAGHTEYPRHMSSHGNPLQSLPFAGSVVIVHDDSVSHSPDGIVQNNHQHSPLKVGLSRMKNGARTLPKIRPLTGTMRRDYTIPTSEEIHHLYRNGSRDRRLLIS